MAATTSMDQEHDPDRLGPTEPRDHEAALYRHVETLAFTDLPDSTVESCSAAVLDHFGCAALGATLPWTSTLLAVLEAGGELRPPVGPAARAHIYGRSGPVPPTAAALVNATATHGFDLDDTHLPTMTHPGCVVIPAAVAAAEVSACGGRDFLTAVVAGYEVMGRVARAAGLGYGEKGFHATGQLGPMGAAAACSRLLGGDPPRDGRLPGAVGLAASFGGGIKAFSTGAGMVKRLHAGRAAQAGLFAATLQRSGFTGPPHAVAGKFGYVPTFSTDGNPDYASLSEGLGRRHVVDEVYLKPYAACGAVHGAVAAASALALKPGEAVERVVVGTSRRALAQNSIPDPADVMAAQYSVEYSVALALTGAAGDVRRYLDAGTGNDGAVRELASRVTLRVDEAVDRAYPDSNEARVDLLMSDGSRRSAHGAVSATTSRGWEVAERKFREVTRGVLEPTVQDRVVRSVAALSGGGTVAACVEALSPSG